MPHFSRFAGKTEGVRLRVLLLLLLIRGCIRRFFGNCAFCNSDAPKLYECPVCENGEVDKQLWWSRFCKEVVRWEVGGEGSKR